MSISKSLLIIIISVAAAALGAGAYIAYEQRVEPVQSEIGSSSTIIEESNEIPMPKEPRDRPVVTEEAAIDTFNWQIYYNEKYGFELRYPTYLSQKTLFAQPFNPGLEGSIITTFSDGRTNELVVAVSPQTLDGYTVVDNPGGVFYRFDQKKGIWVSSIRGEVTGQEPKLLPDVSVTAYDYRSGDGICQWHGAVIPHPKELYVLELLAVSCVDEGQRPGSFGRTPDLNLTEIVNTLRFINNEESADWKSYQSSTMGFSLRYPADWVMSSERPDFGGKRIDFTHYGNQLGVVVLAITRGAAIYSQEKGRNLTFEELVETERRTAQSNADPTEEYIFLDNHPAIAISYTQYWARGDQYIRTTAIYARDRDFWIHFSMYNYNVEKKDTYLRILNQILSTFRFMN